MRGCSRSVFRITALALALGIVAPAATVLAQGQTPPAPKQPAAPAAPTTGGHQAPPTTGPLPPLRVTPGTIDFGVANPDLPIHVSVKVANTAPRSIRIAEVRPTCKCTVPTLPKNILTPGEEIEIPVVLDLRGSLGDVQKPFDIYVDGFARPWTVVVKGILQYPIQVTPDKLDAIPARKGEITLKAVDGKPFNVISVHGVPPQVVERKPAGEKESNEWTIQWDVNHLPKWPYMLVVETDRPECRVLTLRFWGGAISEAELKYIKNWKQIFINRVNVNFGVIPAGGSVEIEVPISRGGPRTDPCELSFYEDRIDTTSPEGLTVELVRAVPVDGRPADENYLVKVTNTSDTKRTVCTPLYFSTKNNDPEAVKNELGGAVRSPGEFLARCWIGGVLEGKNES